MRSQMRMRAGVTMNVETTVALSPPHENIIRLTTSAGGVGGFERNAEFG